jgi:hypothetical protein
MCGINIKVVRRSTPITIIKSGSRAALPLLPAVVASGTTGRSIFPSFRHSIQQQSEAEAHRSKINQSINRLTSCCGVSVVVDDVAPMLAVVFYERAAEHACAALKNKLQQTAKIQKSVSKRQVSGPAPSFCYSILILLRNSVLIQ